MLTIPWLGSIDAWLLRRRARAAWRIRRRLQVRDAVNESMRQ